MKFITSLILLVFAVFQCQAQSDISRLLSNLNGATSDTARINAYNQLYEFYQFANPDSANYYLEDGLKYFTEHKNRLGVASMTTLLGCEDASHGRMELAMKRHTDALKIFEELNYKPGIGSANNGLGVAEGKMGNFADATRHFLTALKVYESISNTKGIVNGNLKLGAVNEQTNNLDKALEYYNKALALCTDSQTNSSRLFLYNNIGIVYGKKEDFVKALEFLQKALDQSNTPRFAGIHILSLINTGIIYDHLGISNKALDCLTEALNISKEKNLPDEQARITVNMAAIIEEKDPEKAIGLLKSALELTDRINQKTLREDIYSNLVECYKKTGDYKEAVSVMEQQRAVEDSTFSIEKAKEIANIQSVYELEQSNTRIKVLEQTNRINLLKRNIIICIAALLSIALVFMIFFYVKTSRLNEKLSKREAELERSNTVKDKLFSIVGHDLRGPIGNIPVMLNIMNDSSTSPEEMEYLSDSLLQHSIATKETLDKLLLWGKTQIKGGGLQQVRLDSDEHIKNNTRLLKSSADQKNITIRDNVVDRTMVLADEAHFDFVIRNILSNAIKFTHQSGTIEISAEKSKKSDFIIFSVSDTGMGIPPEKITQIFEPYSSSTTGTADERGSSIGLILCKEFVIENGGDIWAENKKDKGSIFYFTFKAA